MKQTTAEALVNTLSSPNESDRNGETANVVDAVCQAARSLKKIALAVNGDSAPGFDASDGKVSCLTEAVMGVTAGLIAVSRSLSEIAEAIRESKAGPE